MSSQRYPVYASTSDYWTKCSIMWYGTVHGVHGTQFNKLEGGKKKKKLQLAFVGNSDVRNQASD